MAAKKHSSTPANPAEFGLKEYADYHHQGLCGTAEQFVASGLLSREQIPGEPGCPMVRALRFERDGYEYAVNRGPVSRMVSFYVTRKARIERETERRELIRLRRQANETQGANNTRPAKACRAAPHNAVPLSTWDEFRDATGFNVPCAPKLDPDIVKFVNTISYGLRGESISLRIEMEGLVREMAVMVRDYARRIGCEAWLRNFGPDA